MMSRIAKKLDELGIALPQPNAPVANYVPSVRSGSLLFISGQISNAGADIIRGKLGADLTVEQGAAAARLCAINLIAQMSAALGGDLERVKRIVKLGGFVNCTPDFFDQPKVLNGASDLMVAVFGDAGKHARAAVGAPSLPLGAAVEVDAIVEID
jgi:enamine deaminase RidA (YjgF/YER057c/UK114 family)